MLVDALVIRVRLDGRVRQRSLLLATGVNGEGYRDLLGLHLGDKESEASWGAFFAHLKQRGLSGVDLVVSDSHGGLVNAIHAHFQGAVWQRCQTHLTPQYSVGLPRSGAGRLAQSLTPSLRSRNAPSRPPGVSNAPGRVSKEGSQVL